MFDMDVIFFCIGFLNFIKVEVEECFFDKLLIFSSMLLLRLFLLVLVV